MLMATGVEVTFGVGRSAVPALRGVDLAAEDGQLTAILGPSGCGKTTLLRVLAGFIRPGAGEVRHGELVLSGDRRWVRPERRGIGFVPQHGALFPHLTVARNVGFGLSFGSRFRTPAGRAQRRRAVEETLEMVGLGGLGARRPDELSGGQQQRVALARALALRPEVVLLDEPFSAVDANLREQLGRDVTGLLRGLGTTAVLVTHDQAEALSLADRVAVMREGKVVQTATPSELYSRPADPDTARFVGDVVMLPAQMQGAGAVTCVLGAVALADAPRPGASTGTACTAMLRPEQLRLAADGAPARVVARHFYGHDAMLTLHLDSAADAPDLLVRSFGAAIPNVGDRVGVAVDGSALLFP